MAPQRGTVGASGELGVYGLRLSNIESGRRMLSPASASWPHLEVKRRRGAGGIRAGVAHRDRRAAEPAERGRDRARAAIARGSRSCSLAGPDGRAHPPAARTRRRGDGVLARPRAFHAGGFVAGGKTWGDPRRSRVGEEHDDGAACARRCPDRRRRPAGRGRLGRLSPAPERSTSVLTRPPSSGSARASASSARA